jgi:hypothetical protein
MGAPRFVMDDFWPSDLFLGGIPGAWYDPTDLSTMFQDSAGTTPVTAVEQPVGLVLDKSQGLALGPDLITNGGPFVNTTGWTAIAGATLSVDSGRLKVAQGLTDFVTASQAIATVAGRTYRVTYDLVSDGTSSPSFVVYARQFPGSTNIALSTTGFGTGKTLYFTAVGATTYIEPGSGTSADNIYGLFNNIKVELVAGNHASQSNAASRPTYRARYNLLTQSEDFSQAVWQKNDGATVTTDAVVAPDGTLTADALNIGVLAVSRVQQPLAVLTTATMTYSLWMRVASGTEQIRFGDSTTLTTFTVTSTWQRFTVVVNIAGTAPNLTIRNDTAGGAKTIYAWGAQLLTAADVTATGNAYQRIAAATVYDTAAVFRPYLAFDGLDDSLSTSAINFTSTDKMTVFAGVTKSSDAALGIVSELGNRNLVQAGSFTLNAPRSAGNPTYAFVVEGTAVTDNTITGYTAPITNVLTARGDIAAPLNQLRVNGAVAGTLTTTLGTGNFGNWALYVGRRNNATFPFNGRLYSLIVRGAASSTTEIFDAELWVNARTGAY